MALHVSVIERTQDIAFDVKVTMCRGNAASIKHGIAIYSNYETLRPALVHQRLTIYLYSSKHLLRMAVIIKASTGSLLCSCLQLEGCLSILLFRSSSPLFTHSRIFCSHLHDMDDQISTVCVALDIARRHVMRMSPGVSILAWSSSVFRARRHVDHRNYRKPQF